MNVNKPYADGWKADGDIISQDYPFDISQLGQEFIAKKNYVRIYAEKRVRQNGTDYDLPYDKTFIIYPE